MNKTFKKDWQYYKFCSYGFLKNQRFFEPFLILIFLWDKGLSFTEIGTLYAIRFILRTLLEIPSGFAADALGRKRTLIVSYGFYCLSFVAYYLADSFLWLIIPSVLFAFGDAFRTGTHKAMIFEYLKKNGWAGQKVAYYGQTRSWSQFGSAISSLVAAGLILLNQNFKYIFLYSLVPYLLGMIILSSYPKWLNWPASSSDKALNFRKDIPEVIRNSLKALKNKQALRLNFSVATFSGFYHSSRDYLQIVLTTGVAGIVLLKDIQRPETEKQILFIGLVYFILYFLNSVAARSAGRVKSLFNTDASFLNSLLIIGLCLSIGAGAMYQLNLHVLALVLFLSIIIIENIRRPGGVGIIAEHFDSGILASVLSVESQLSSLLGALLSLLIGILTDLWGFGYALMLCSVLVLILYPFMRIKRKTYAN